MQSVLRALKKLLIISGILIVFGYVGNLLIDNPYVHRVLRDLINKELDDYTYLSVKFEAINVRFFPIGVDLYGLELRQKSLPNNRPLVQTSHIRVRLSLLATLLSKPELLNIEINEPKLDLPLPPLEQLLRLEKFPELIENKSEPIFWPLQLRLPFYRLAVQNLQLDILIPSEKKGITELLHSRLEGLDFTFLYHSTSKFDINMHLKRGNLVVEDSHLLRDTEIKADLFMNGDELKSSFLRISSNELTAQSELSVKFETSKPTAKAGLFDNERKVLKNIAILTNHQIEHADLAILGRFLEVDRTQGTLSGQLEGKISIPIAENKVDWLLKGSAQAENALLAGFKLFQSKLDYSISERGLSFDKALVIKDQKQLAKATGFLGFERGSSFSFSLDADALPFKTLMSILQVDDFDSLDTQLETRQLSLKGRANPFQMKIEGIANFQNLSFPFVKDLPQKFLAAPSCSLDTTLLIDLNQINIDRAVGNCSPGDKVTNKQSPIELAGSFHFSQTSGMDLTLTSKDFQAELLQHFTKLPSLGTLAPKVAIKGPYDKLTITSQIEAKDLEIGGFSFAQVSSQLQLPISENTVYIPSFRARVGAKGELQLLKSSLKLAEPYDFKTEIQANNLPEDFIGKGLAKSFSIEDFHLTLQKFSGAVSGPLLQPFLYRGSLAFELQNLKAKSEQLASQFNAKLEADSKNWSLDDIFIRLDDIKAQGGLRLTRTASRKMGNDIWGKLGLSTSDQINLEVKTITHSIRSYRTNDLSESINHLTSLPYIGNFFRSQNFGAEVQLEAKFEGTYQALDGQFQLNLEQPYIWDIPISSISLSGYMTDGKLNVSEIRHSGNALVGRFLVDFTKEDLPYEWYFYLQQLDIRAFLGKRFADDPRNFAYLTADWSMAGKLKRFWSSQGEFTISRVRSKLFKDLGSQTSSVELNSDDPMRVLIAPDKWQFADNRPLRLKGDFFDLEFRSAQTRLPDNLDISLKGSVKLEVLKSFTSLVENAKGELLLDGYLKGSLENPDFSLRIKERKLDPFSLSQWVPLSLNLVDIGPAFSNISVDAEVKSDRLIVHRFSSNKGREGTLNISGILGYGPETADISKLNIQLSRIEFNRMNIPILKTADMLLSGDLVVSGSSMPYHISGGLRIDRFQSIGNFDLRRELFTSLYDSKIISGVSKQVSAENRPKFTLDLGLDADRSILIKNKSVEAVLSSNLRIRGDDINPLLLGQIIADKGSFSYRRQFKMSKAVISFDEPVSPPNPRIDIIGETTINPYQVQVAVTGDLNSPKINLTCDPPNREDGSTINNLDIFLLLTTGKIPDQANKTAGRASVNELFSSFLVFAEEPIEKLFDISGQTVIREVYIDSYLSETEQRPITRLNVPFNLWGFANAVVQVDDESNSKVSFEYPIHEGITFSGSLVDRKANSSSNKQSNSAAETGFDLKFRFGFD